MKGAFTLASQPIFKQALYGRPGKNSEARGFKRLV